MLKQIVIGGTAVAALTIAANGSAALLEDYQFNDAAATGLGAVVNDVDPAGQFGGNAANVETNGLGSLVLTQGVDASDNVFRDSSPARGLTTGVVTYSIGFESFNLSDATAGTTNIGFGTRSIAGSEDVLIRLSEAGNGTVRLQARYADGSGSTPNANLVNIGTGLQGPVDVIAVIDLDSDTLDISYDLNDGNGFQSTGTLTISSTLDVNTLRTATNTNTGDFGAADFVNVDYITLDHVVPEPGSLVLLGAGALVIIGRRRA